MIYLIPVPIGNLGDITLRALDTLKKVSLIACEDTRKTAFLLSQYEIPVPQLISFPKFNERKREQALFEHLERGEDLAVVSDAGSPAISDPAQRLVAEAVKRNLPVQALPGATAFVPALSISGFSTSAFQFIGFLPAKNKDREAVLMQIAAYPYPSIVYESVHHLKACLEDMARHFPSRRITIAREISKLHEECIRGTIETILADYEITEKGEFVIVIDGPDEVEIEFPNALAAQMIAESGDKKSRELAAELAQRFGISKKRAYQYVLEQRK
ncbi:MAG: 16S rRNA (cytidine(1402)-2'-O)-methyltransferase [Candidatus Cloacimonetes bacterium]|nr:16S rRNA (cytidine(1402)-2'-O)-methyltransferase [Candidatus Cloacimonadota bacterium]